MISIHGELHSAYTHVDYNFSRLIECKIYGKRLQYFWAADKKESHNYYVLARNLYNYRIHVTVRKILGNYDFMVNYNIHNASNIV